FALAGLRIGYAVSEKSLIKKLHASLPPWSVNTLASVAAVETLKDGTYKTKIERWFAKEQPALFSVLSEIDALTVYPSSANYFTIKIKGGAGEAANLVKALRKEGVLIRSLADFTGLGSACVRVSVRKSAENRLLTDKLKQYFR
ncbi:MAG: aminotransferase class I/II-fold pyridoxal phosphate-dependent enzyme, partial [Thermodesulfobacteriota bacterium]